MAFIAARPSGAVQDAEPPGFAASERVTAVDLVVEAARGLEPADLEVVEDGQPRRVVGVEQPGEAEPWRLVVYFELPLAEPEGVRWAADALAGRAADLVALGAVEVVVADPEPRTALPPTRDAGAVAATLAAIAGRAQAGDELVRLRREVAREVAGGDGGSGDETAGGAAELARTAAAEESRFVEERADALLLRLVATAAEPGVGARRALLLVASGWDPEPSAFYRARLGDAKSAEAEQEAAGAAPWPEGTGAATEALARTLAAYGWITLALAPPVPQEPEWHLRRRAQVAIDGMHRPEAGEAYLELGRALAEQGELERAAEAYREAIHAFYDHPASASRQAAAEASLGDVLERLGRPEEAERWRRRALARDPDLASRYPGAAAVLAEPRTPLARLAEATAGRLVREDPEQPGVGALEAALDSLEKRVRITYQRPGEPTGELATVTARRAGRQRPLPAPGWARSGTPETVAEARLRRFVASGYADGATLAVTAAAVRGGMLTIGFDPPAEGPLADPDHRSLLRVSVAAVDPEGGLRVDHSAPDPLIGGSHTAGEPWSFRKHPPTSLVDGEPAAALVEDLASGVWGIAAVAVTDARPADDPPKPRYRPP